MTIQILTWLMPVLGVFCCWGCAGGLWLGRSGWVTPGFQLPGTKHVLAKADELCRPKHVRAGRLGWSD